MTQSSSGQPGPLDDATVEQTAGEGSGLEQSQPAGGGHEREVGVTAAVERGPAELSDEGEPVRPDEHASVTGEEPARSTDDLQAPGRHGGATRDGGEDAGRR